MRTARHTKRLGRVESTVSEMRKLELYIEKNNTKGSFFSLVIMCLYILIDFFGAVEYVISHLDLHHRATYHNALLWKISGCDFFWYCIFAQYSCRGVDRPRTIRAAFIFSQVMLIVWLYESHWHNLHWFYRALLLARLMLVALVQNAYYHYLRQCSFEARRLYQKHKAKLNKSVSKKQLEVAVQRGCNSAQLYEHVKPKFIQQLLTVLHHNKAKKD